MIVIYHIYLFIKQKREKRKARKVKGGGEAGRMKDDKSRIQKRRGGRRGWRRRGGVRKKCGWVGRRNRQ